MNLPDRGEASQAKEGLNTTLKTQTPKLEIEEQIEQFLASEGNDLNYALAKLRMELEKELRRILEKHPESAISAEQDTKFRSARSLFMQFIRQFPDYQGIESSFDYVLRICNSAIHGHYTPEKYAYEALSMGFRMLAELRSIDGKEF